MTTPAPTAHPYRGPTLFCLGVALGAGAWAVLLNLPDRVIDVGVRVLNKVHRRD